MPRIISALAVAGLVLGAASATALTQAPAASAATTPSPISCTMAAGSGLPTHDTAGHVNGTIDVLDAQAQVLPARRFAGASAATVCAARDSYASFQLEVTAGSTPITNLSMSAGTLTGPGGATLPGTAAGAASDVQFDREDYVTLSRLSDGELDPAAGSPDTVTPAASRVSRNEATGVCTDTADACQFPDVLVPDRDSVYGEVRNAFQGLTVTAGQNRTIWADVFVPANTPAGIFTGSVTVTQSSGVATTVPVQLTVANVTLPATSTMDTAFFYEGPNGDPAGYQAAAELGLDDRISVVPDGIVGGAGPAAIVGPLLNGTDSHVRLQDASGRRASITDLPLETNAGSGAFTAYKPLFTAGVTAKPWAYCDEVGYSECAANYTKNAAPAWAGIPLLAIDAAAPFDDVNHKWSDPKTQVAPSALSSMLGGVVDLQQFIQPAEGWLAAAPQYATDTSDRSAYLRAWAAGGAGRQAWSYVTNMSGSSTYYPTVARYAGYTSYGIDQVSSEQEATGWQNFTDGLTGALYWSVNQAPASSLNTAKSGLTGDGTLFYPYNATQVGGTHSVPLESIRLKRIRNGQQDYELLHLADIQKLALPDGRTARTIAATLMPSLSASAVTASAMDNAEQDLLRLFPMPVTAPAKINPNDLNCDGTPDFLGVQTGSGRLMFYPRTATDWAPNAPILENSGFGSGSTPTYTTLLLPGDLNGDGKPDLLARKADGSMWLYPGTCTGSFGAAVNVGITTTAPSVIGDFNGDGRADLLDKHADGTLWLFAGAGNGTFAAATQVGAGWANLQIVGAGDVNHDGAADVLARQSDGSVLLYEGTGLGGWKTVTGGLATGLTLPAASYPSLFGVGDLSGDGNADLVAIDSTGTMWRYNGNGVNSLATTATRIGGGWTPANLIQVAQ